MAHLITVQQFSERFGVPRSSFYRLVKAGQLSIIKVGRSSRVAVADAERWAASLPRFGGQVRP
jgi:excisionase family DNA binding protein